MQNKIIILCTGALVFLALIAALAPYVAPYDPVQVNLDTIKQPPGQNHWMGTDKLGRDILSRIIYGGRFSLLIGITATIVSMCIGIVIGLIASYRGGIVDTVLAMVTDIFLAFPSLLLAIGISVLLPPGLISTMAALCLVGWASFARLFRGMTLSLKECVFVDAGRAVGCSSGRILFSHILPHCLPIALVAGSLKIGGFILAESALSFLGLGVQPPTPTWGAMISLNRSYLPTAPWMVMFPGLAIAITVILFNVLGDAIRDAVDPRLKL